MRRGFVPHRRNILGDAFGLEEDMFVHEREAEVGGVDWALECSDLKHAVLLTPSG